MFRAFLLSFQHIATDPGIRRTFFKTVLVSVLVWAAVVGLGIYGVLQLSFFQDSFLNWLAHAAAVLVIVFVGSLLFSGLSILISGFFVEDICPLIEERYYPNAGRARAIGWREIALTTVQFLLLSVVLGVLAAVLGLASLFLAPLSLVALYCVNGYLLSREYFELAALRHYSIDEVRALRRNNPWPLYPAGAMLAAMSVIPGVALLVPFLGVSVMTHLLQQIKPTPTLLPVQY